MQVTPRVAAPADMQEFVEIRYFRFGAASVSAALLFGLTECVNSARFSSVRKNFLRLCASRELKSLLKQTLACPPSTLLQAWNYDQELYTRLRKGLTGLTLLDEEVFPIQLAYYVKCTLKVDGDGTGEGVRDCRRDIPVLEIAHVGGEVVLGYRVYSMESVAVSVCGHVHLKSALFRAFREHSNGVPLNLLEASHSLTIPCSTDCTENLISTIFTLAETDNQSYDLSQYRTAYLRLQDSTASKPACDCAHKQGKTDYYECKHEVCWMCVVSGVLVSGDIMSKCCGKPVKRNFIKDLWLYVREMKGVRGNFSISCTKCDQKMPFLSEFISLKLKHVCLLCDNCLLFDINTGHSNGYCPACDAAYIPNDIITLFQDRESPETAAMSLSRSSDGSYRPEESSRKCCVCRNSLSRGDTGTCLRLNDSCLVCDSCRVREKSHCPVCNKAYIDKDQMIIDAMQSSAVVLPPVVPAKKCICGNIITPQRIYCSMNCYCAMCLLRHYVKDKIRLCPKCNVAVEGNLPESVQCSGCFRPLQVVAPDFHSSVFDVCPRGCILCCYCVRLPSDGALGSCPLCREAISALEWREVEASQRAFPCACVCASPVVPDSTLKCGHPVHTQCISTIYNCRLCWFSHQPRDYTLTLAWYLQ